MTRMQSLRARHLTCLVGQIRSGCAGVTERVRGCCSALPRAMAVRSRHLEARVRIFPGARPPQYLPNLLRQNEAIVGVSTPRRGCGPQGTKSVADHFNPLAKAPCIARVALPDRFNPPAYRLKVPSCAAHLERHWMRAWESNSRHASWDSMPVRSPDADARSSREQDNQSMLWQHDVWLSGQIASTQPKSKSHRTPQDITSEC